MNVADIYTLCKSSTQVDGEPWYTIVVRPRVLEWLREQNQTEYHIEKGGLRYARVDVSEKLLTVAKLKFTYEKD